ncbi:putative phosphatidylserine decarboxylase [Glonium stellatum]|uniref:phosphatidylserine decarboxylase n=1 Tax=Glonium stellatum TaxID=574774 RepID=A0A8E2EV92_9PEZI|nr:putative phosphatidylserine decarboxylase [Glonium stellatum]
MVSLTAWSHSLLDYLLSFCSLIQNREVGWKTWDRRTGQFMREKQLLWKKTKLLVLFNPILERIDNTHALRPWIHDKTIKEGIEEGKSISHHRIKPFIDFYHINMKDFSPSDPDAYAKFEDFFVRAHADSSRPIHAPSDPSSAVVVADSRVVVHETVSFAQRIWIKGRDFTMAEFLQDNIAVERFADGAIASFRLSPQDYHRYHSPVSGTIKEFRSLPGDFYNVDPIALTSRVDILTRNARCWIRIRTEQFGDVVFVAIGATDVGTVKVHEQWHRSGAQIQKGDEVGIFQFGGSSIIVAFEKDRIVFDEDLSALSKRAIMVDVEVGMSLGRAKKV